MSPAIRNLTRIDYSHIVPQAGAGLIDTACAAVRIVERHGLPVTFWFQRILVVAMPGDKAVDLIAAWYSESLADGTSKGWNG